MWLSFNLEIVRLVHCKVYLQIYYKAFIIKKEIEMLERNCTTNGNIKENSYVVMKGKV